MNMNNVSKYKFELQTVMARFRTERVIKNFEKEYKFKEIAALVDDAVLADAFQQSDAIKSVFKIEQTRPQKQYRRFEQKQKEEKNIDKPFKWICDFTGFRITEKDIHKYKSIHHNIHTIVKNAHGYCFDKQEYFKDDRVTSIAIYMYIYLQNIGHIIECQLLHPFAAYAFADNSAHRDNKNHISLFRESEHFRGEARPVTFYHLVEEIILKKVNPEDIGDLYRLLQNHYRKNGKLGRAVPDSLRDLLREIYTSE